MDTNIKYGLMVEGLSTQMFNVDENYLSGNMIKRFSKCVRQWCVMCAVFATVIFGVIMMGSVHALPTNQADIYRATLRQAEKNCTRNAETLRGNVPIVHTKEVKFMETAYYIDDYNTYYKANKSLPRMIAYNFDESEMKGFKYVHLSDDKVKLFIESEDAVDADKVLRVPSVVYDSAGRRLQVVKVSRMFERLDVKEVVFVSGFEDLIIDVMLFENSLLEEVRFEGAIKKLQICHSAFKRCDNLEKVEIPDSVTDLLIGNMAFYGCTKLSDFKVSASSKMKSLRVGYMSFYKCVQLVGFTIENCRELESFVGEEAAFSECVRLASFKMPSNIENLTIDRRIFFHCSALNDILLPTNLTSLKIECFAFSGCVSITKLKIPEKVLNVTIGYSAFSECTGITEFEVPQRVINLDIDEKAFSKSGLTKFIIRKGSQMKNLNIGKETFSECAGITSFEVPASVENLKVGCRAFCNTNLICFTIEGNSKLKEFFIEWGAFKQCRVLTELQIPESVEILQVGDKAFNQSGLEKFIFKGESRLTKVQIGKEAFSECKGLTDIEIPDRVKDLQIGILAFNKCSSLKSFAVKANSQLQKLMIGGGAFNECVCITSIVVPDSVIDLDVEMFAFYNCRQLTTFIIKSDSKLKDLLIGQDAFGHTKVICLEVPESVEDLVIEEDAFRWCALESFKIKSDSNLKSLFIGRSAFEKNRITSFEVPASVKDLEIEACAFSGCALRSFTLQDGIQLEKLHIENRAFMNTLITNFEVPASVKDLNIGEYAFSECAIESFSIQSGSSLTSVTIENFAFRKCLKLTRFDMRNCFQLKRIMIGKEAFYVCDDLLQHNFVLPKSVNQMIIFENSFDKVVPDSLKDSTLFKLHREEDILVWTIISSKSLKIILDKKLYDMFTFAIGFVNMWAVEMIEIRKEFLADVDISVDLGEDMGDFVQSGDTITIRSLYGDRSLELSDFEDYCYED